MPVPAEDRTNVVVGMLREVLKGADEGSGSNRQIASVFHLVEGTVKRDLANAYEKIGVNCRGEAARKALREGWITPTDITDEQEEA